MTIKKIFLKSLPMFGFSMFILTIVSVLVYFTGINDFDNTRKGVYFALIQILIMLMFYPVYWLPVSEIIDNIAKTWKEKVLEQRNWLNHRDLLSKKQTVIFIRVLVTCLFIIQTLVWFILYKMGTKGISGSTFTLVSVLLLLYFLWASSSLVQKAVNKINTSSLYYKWRELYNFLNENKQISDNHFLKLDREYNHLLNLRSKMNDFETIEVDTKISKVKYLLLEVQKHLEGFKNERVNLILSEIPNKANKFYHGDNENNSTRGKEYAQEFIDLCKKIGVNFENVNVGKRNNNLEESFPHNYFDFHLEQLNAKEEKKLQDCISNLANIESRYGALILDHKIDKEIDEYFK